tara:strand:- start:85100 stop:85762 length:663 start_codon:yes stop_codon:yes gene_type:complete
MTGTGKSVPTSKCTSASTRRSSKAVKKAKPAKQSSRERLLVAAIECFTQRGFAHISVEDIAAYAGVSRMTFYRHFNDKGDIAAALLRHGFAKHQPDLLRIGDIDWRDRAIVRDWIRHLFESDRENRLLLRAFVQASSVDQNFTQRAHDHISALIVTLGEKIPAFALREGHPDDRRRWVEAWLLLYELLDQSNHAALDSGVASDPIMLDILTDRFLAFVSI